MLPYIRLRFANLLSAVRQYQEGLDWAWLALIIQGAVAGSILMSLLGAVLWICSDLSTNPARSNALQRGGWYAAGITVLFSVLLGIGNALRYQFVEGWFALLHNPLALVSLVGFVSGGFLVGPVMLALWRPALVHNRWLNGAYIFALISVTVASGSAIWLAPAVLPRPALVFLAPLGVAVILLGLNTLRMGVTVLDTIVDVSPLTAGARPGWGSAYWHDWLDKRLSVEKQRELKRALDERYPTSRAQTLLSLLVVGAGGWLLSAVIGAIVEWVVQGWLDQFTR